LFDNYNGIYCVQAYYVNIMYLSPATNEYSWMYLLECSFRLYSVKSASYSFLLSLLLNFASAALLCLMSSSRECRGRVAHATGSKLPQNLPEVKHSFEAQLAYNGLSLYCFSDRRSSCSTCMRGIRNPPSPVRHVCHIFIGPAPRNERLGRHLFTLI